jgi:hypothetical protein
MRSENFLKHRKVYFFYSFRREEEEEEKCSLYSFSKRKKSFREGKAARIIFIKIILHAFFTLVHIV